jgi:hypothetical protein
MLTIIVVDSYPAFQGQPIYDDDKATIFRRADTRGLVFFDKVNRIALDLPDARKRRRGPSGDH